MRFAFDGGMSKRAQVKPKSASQASHPETKNSAKTGVPGSESSKVRNGGKDVRSAHDKDGNGEQRGR